MSSAIAINVTSGFTVPAPRTTCTRNPSSCAISSFGSANSRVRPAPHPHARPRHAVVREDHDRVRAVIHDPDQPRARLARPPQHRRRAVQPPGRQRRRRAPGAARHEGGRNGHGGNGKEDRSRAHGLYRPVSGRTPAAVAARPRRLPQRRASGQATYYYSYSRRAAPASSRPERPPDPTAASASHRQSPCRSGSGRCRRRWCRGSSCAGPA